MWTFSRKWNWLGMIGKLALALALVSGCNFPGAIPTESSILEEDLPVTDDTKPSVTLEAPAQDEGLKAAPGAVTSGWRR